MQVWSLEKENTSDSFSSKVFLHYYKFILKFFKLFIWFFHFCNLKKNILLYFPFLVSFVSISFLQFLCFYFFFGLCLFHVFIFSILILSIFIFLIFIYLFI
jgi:hypothetical protein